jgi:hypothetical protein
VLYVKCFGFREEEKRKSRTSVEASEVLFLRQGEVQTPRHVTSPNGVYFREKRTEKETNTFISRTIHFWVRNLWMIIEKKESPRRQDFYTQALGSKSNLATVAVVFKCQKIRHTHINIISVHFWASKNINLVNQFSECQDRAGHMLGYPRILFLELQKMAPRTYISGSIVLFRDKGGEEHM